MSKNNLVGPSVITNVIVLTFYVLSNGLSVNYLNNEFKGAGSAYLIRGKI
jgi:hypothetical protein